MKKKLVILLALIASYFSGKAQIDTEFWFSCPEVMQHGTNNMDRPIILRLTTYAAPATVTISVPASLGVLGIITIPANSFQSFDLTPWIDSIENRITNSVLNRGLKITSTASISAYYDVVGGAAQVNPEVFCLKGNNALGNSFTIPGQLKFNNISSYAPQSRNSFDLVATENGTVVTITPAQNIDGHLANIPYTVNLNLGQTYSASAATHFASNHLNGSTVTSNKPIAITVKDDGLYVDNYCVDLTGDQIVPTSKIGNNYIAIKGNFTADSNEIFIVTATQNSTQIFKDGVLQTTINAGQSYTSMIGSTQNATYIQSSAPSYVWQVTGAGCEAGATQLPQIDCSGSDNISYLRMASVSLTANVLVPNGHQGNFLVNGLASTITAAMFTAVPGTGGAWLYARVNLNTTIFPVGTVIKVENTSSKFHLSMIDQSSGGTGYAYFSDFGSINASASANPNPFCIGDNINLTAGSVSGANYSWTGPAGFSSSLQNPTIASATLANEGWYVLHVSDSSCSDIDSIYVSLFDCPTKDTCEITAKYCIDVDNPQTYMFDATGISAGGSYFWDFGDGNNASSPTGNINHTYGGPGTYTVTIIYTNPNGTECIKNFEICVSEKRGKGGTDLKQINGNDNVIGTLYPNPGQTEVYIPINTNNKAAKSIHVQIISVDGKIVYNGPTSINNKQIHIPIQQFNDGMYLVKINYDGIEYHKKFVKASTQ